MSFRMTSGGTSGAMVPGTINKPQSGSSVKSSLPTATAESSYLYYTNNKWEVGDERVRIGENSGYTGQGSNSVAIGKNTGQSNQGSNAIAIGSYAGQINQGLNAVAIGNKAGQSNQGLNTICINATGQDLFTKDINGVGVTGGFFVKPIRNVESSTMLMYNTNTSEITYLPTANYVYNETNLAPRGASDTWIASTEVVGGTITHLNNKIFTNSDTLAYSTDGGISFTPCTIIIPIGSSIFQPAYNPVTGVYLVLTAQGTTVRCFMSFDGINWTLLSKFQSNILGTGGKTTYFNGYFISVCLTGVIVSLTGELWIPINFSGIPNSFASGYDENNTPILVTQGVNTYYTYDALTWTLSGTNSGKACVYSYERQEFIIQSTTGSFYKSTTGRKWDIISTSSYGELNALIWVGNDSNNIPINQYYFPTIDANSNFTLTYSPTCSTGTFGSIFMNGAKFNGVDGLYSVQYIPQYDRFLYNVFPYLYYADKTNQTATQKIVLSEIIVPEKLTISGQATLLSDNNLKITINGLNYTIALTPVV